MIEAQVICDSVSPAGKRLTTFKLRYPKFIHGEFMTHRVLSRNASSSRAIPTQRLIEEVRSDALRAAPIHWGANQKGMQAAEELTGATLLAVQRLWHAAALSAAQLAEAMTAAGAHKQLVNRLLEPFSHIAVVATATEWDNFFGLRLHHMAQLEMRALAEAMWRAYGDSTPAELVPGQWHLPLVNIDGAEDSAACMEHPGAVGDDWLKLLIQVSVARCARVSYDSLVSPGKRSTIEEDLATYAKLNLPGSATYDPLQPIHASPAEHQATPDDEVEWGNDKIFGEETREGPKAACPECNSPQSIWANPELHGNLVGWRQYRKTLAGETVAPLPPEYQG